MLIEQVLINILENAVKYTPAGSAIDISAASVGGAVRVDIADRGPGFATGEEERVFDKFYRSPGAKGRGVGLGLAISRAIIDTHGGTIWAEPRAGGGAVFHFTLPIGDAAARGASRRWMKRRARRAPPASRMPPPSAWVLARGQGSIRRGAEFPARPVPRGEW